MVEKICGKGEFWCHYVL